MARVAIVTENDAIWALSGWERALPELARHGHDVVGVWAVPGKLGRLMGVQIPLWYVRRLGVMVFTKLALFAVVHKLARWRGQRPMHLKAMAGAHGVKYFTAHSPNDAAFVTWLHEQDVDVLLITVGHILQREVLAAPKVGVINKHAGLLPQNRGLWPFVWAVVRGMPQGISYHVVNEKVDAGAVLLQDNQVPESAKASMIAYYAYVYGVFGRQMAQAVEKLLRKEFMIQGDGVENETNPLPDVQVLARFRDKGGVVIRMRDVRLAVSLAEGM